LGKHGGGLFGIKKAERAGKGIREKSRCDEVDAPKKKKKCTVQKKNEDGKEEN